MHDYIGQILVYGGVLLLALGLIFRVGGAGLFSWFGNLPGDIRVERENFRLYFPLTTMIIISIVLNLIIRIIRIFI